MSAEQRGSIETTTARRASAPTVLEPTAISPTPEVVGGRYRIVSRIGSGGMGEVFGAIQLALGRTVAVKLLRRELCEDAELVNRFQREAMAATRVGQENIVEVIDLGKTTDGRCYIVMEYLEGETLAELLRRNGALPVARTLNIFAQTSRALSAAHQKGIVHRDLKPENVMVLQRDDHPDFVKVLDFGVAKIQTGTPDTVDTQVGTIIGTPQYMSPEQASARPLDGRTDIYSLGVMLYEMLAGRPPFMGDTPTYLMAAHIFRQPPPLPARPVDDPIPRRLEVLLSRMLAKSPEDRPQSMVEVVRTAGLCLAEACNFPVGSEVPRPLTGKFPRTSAARSPTWRRGGFVAAVGAALLASVLAMWGIRHHNRHAAAASSAVSAEPAQADDGRDDATVRAATHSQLPLPSPSGATLARVATLSAVAPATSEPGSSTTSPDATTSRASPPRVREERRPTEAGSRRDTYSEVRDLKAAPY